VHSTDSPDIFSKLRSGFLYSLLGTPTLTCEGITHKTIVRFGLEGTLQTILFQPPCHGQGPLPPAQGAPSPIQSGLEPCQGGGSHSSSGQPGPGPTHPPREAFLPSIQSKPPLCSTQVTLFTGSAKQ